MDWGHSLICVWSHVNSLEVTQENHDHKGLYHVSSSPPTVQAVLSLIRKARIFHFMNDAQLWVFIIPSLLILEILKYEESETSFCYHFDTLNMLVIHFIFTNSENSIQSEAKNIRKEMVLLLEINV